MNRVFIVCAFLTVLLTSTASGWPAAQHTNSSTEQANSVIAVGVAGLMWSDVTEENTPTLKRLLATSSVGTLSVRAAPGVTCPAEGWLTLGAGSYSAIRAPEEIDTEEGCAQRAVPPVAEEQPYVPSMPKIRELNASLRFGSEPGVLGEKLSCTSAVGPGGALAAADARGYIDFYEEKLPSELESFLARCPFTGVDLGEIKGSGEKRAAQLRALDKNVARIESARGDDALLAVIGVSETQAEQGHLHLCFLHGSGFTKGWLRSPSTRRVPFVQLVDVAPTVLSVADVSIGEKLAGRPLAGEEEGRPESMSETLAQLRDTDRQAVAQKEAVGVFFAGLGVILLLLLGGISYWLYRRKQNTSYPPKVLRWLSILALGVAGIPTATFLANTVPWWRAEHPAVAVWAVVAVLAVVMLAVAVAIGRLATQWSSRLALRISVLSAITLGVFFIDGVTGATLQLNSMLGYNPLVAGRFTGFGNIAFAVYATAGVLLATFISYGYGRMRTVFLLFAVALPVIVFDGVPDWGADFGGVLTLVPAFAVLALLLLRTPVTWLRLGAASLAGVVLVLAIGWLDYLRPPTHRSHFGRFIASFFEGTAFDTIRRKLLTSIELLLMGPHTVAAFAAVIIAVVIVFRPPPSLSDTYETWPVLRLSLVGCVVTAGLAFATNDSGVAIPTVMGLMLLPLVYAVCVWRAVGDPWNAPPLEKNAVLGKL